jgi:hypothetical protein
MGTSLEFEVSQVKALQEDKGDEQGQNKIHDCGGFVAKAVIEGPVAHEGMKQIILSLPAGMADSPKKASREPVGR